MERIYGTEKAKAIEQRIKALGIGDDPEMAEELAFHMIDWIDDLYKLQNLFEHIDQFSDDDVTDVIYGFLIHVPSHVDAARRLAGFSPTGDIFKIAERYPQTNDNP